MIIIKKFALTDPVFWEFHSSRKNQIVIFDIISNLVCIFAAIDKPMVYVNTQELPWDMDIPQKKHQQKKVMPY